MPPVRRGCTAHRPAPYSIGWQSRWPCGDEGELGSDDVSPISVPDDALSPVFARLPAAADVVRCAATCRRWSHLVAKDAAVLSRKVPMLPRLALGFFHQEDARATARTRSRCSASGQAQPCFVSTAAAAGLLGLQNPSFTALADAVPGDGRAGLFEHARPVMARNGWLVLELQRERRADGLEMCVCNPITGDMAMLPPLSGTDHSSDYACALLTGHDLDPPAPLSTFFRLLIVYNRRTFTGLRSYSTDTNGWSAEAKLSSCPKIPTHKLRTLGQSVVLRGVAYWPLGCKVFAVRLDVPEPAELPMPPDGILDAPLGWRSLTIAPGGALMFIMAAVCYTYLTVARIVYRDTGDDKSWEKIAPIRLRHLHVRCEGFDVKKLKPYEEAINLRWLCEKSGIVFFTLGEGTNSPGTFALNLATEKVQKVADGLECHSWRNFVGYEMDGASYLASISRHVSLH